MQYMSQSFRIKDQEIKDLFLDIAAEELGHMEMVAQTINLLNGHDVEAAAVPAGEIESHVLLGLNPGSLTPPDIPGPGITSPSPVICARIFSQILRRNRGPRSSTNTCTVRSMIKK